MTILFQTELDALEAAVKDGNILETAAGNIRTWLLSEHYEEFHDAIREAIAGQKWDELNNGFFEQIEFGTGGMRGNMGLGCARINTRTLGQATEALAQYLETFGDSAKKQGVVVCHEVRESSREFAEYISTILLAHGIRVYLFESFRATPVLSFAVPFLGAKAGVMISASHNPKTDNGYKLYWEQGEQVVEPHASEVMKRVADVGDVSTMSIQDGVAQGLFELIGPKVDAAYVQAVLASSVQGSARDISIVYTPLHGAGQTSTLPALQEAGFDVDPVEEQMVPDGAFSTVNGGKPNPEDPKAFDLALKQARATKADLVFANDPDADRLGVAVRSRDGEYVFLTGNQTGVLILEHILGTRQERGRLTDGDVVVKTMVTTDMVSEVCTKYGVRMVGNLLVGFKYIADVMKQLRADETFVFGVEESLGYLTGMYAHDKDAAGGAVAFAELAAELKADGKTVLEYLDELYQRYGYFVETLAGSYFEGASGKEIMQKMMESLRSNPPQKIGEETVYRVVDRSTGTILDPATGKTLGMTDAPKGNVLVFELSEDGRTKATIRPSGTEPKVKYYVAVTGRLENRQELDARATSIGEAFVNLAESFS